MKGALLLTAMALASPAAAEQVYRCGSVYQQSPCAGGRPVDVSDARSDEDRRAAAAVAKGNSKLAGEMELERRAREAGIRPATATGIGARQNAAQRVTPAVSDKKPRASAKPRDKAEFQAIGPGQRPEKKQKPTIANTLNKGAQP